MQTVWVNTVLRQCVSLTFLSQYSVAKARTCFIISFFPRWGKLPVCIRNDITQCFNGGDFDLCAFSNLKSVSVEKRKGGIVFFFLWTNKCMYKLVSMLEWLRNGFLCEEFTLLWFNWALLGESRTGSSSFKSCFLYWLIHFNMHSTWSKFRNEKHDPHS